MQFLRNSRGFSLLIITIVLSAVTLLIALTVSTTGIQETQNNLRYGLSKTTFAAATGCLEEALLALNQNHNYAGGSLGLNGIACSITITGSGTARTIDILATNAAHTRHLQTQVDWNSQFQVTGWQDLSD